MQPTRFKVEFWTNQYSYDLNRYSVSSDSGLTVAGATKRIIPESVKVTGRKIDMTGNAIEGDYEVPKNRYALDASGSDVGKTKFIKFNEPFYDMVKVSYEIEVDYTNFVPKPGIKTGSIFLSGDVFGSEIFKNYPGAETQMYVADTVYFDIDYIKDRRFLMWNKYDLPNGNGYYEHQLTVIVNGAEETLKHGTEFKIEQIPDSGKYKPKQLYNVVKGEKVKSQETLVTEGVAPNLPDYQFKDNADWELVNSPDRKSLKLLYKGPDTDKTIAVRFIAGLSNEGTDSKYEINKEYQISGRDAEGKLQIDTNTFKDVNKELNGRAFLPTMIAPAEDELEISFDQNNFGNNTNHMDLKNIVIELSPSQGYELNKIRGVKSSDLVGFTINNEKHSLVEGEDYKIRIEENKRIIIEMLKDTNESLTGKVKLDFDMSDLENHFNDRVPVNFFGYAEERGSNIRRQFTNNFYIDKILFSNDPILHYLYSGTDQGEDAEGLPYQKKFYILNPKKRHLEKGKVDITLNSTLNDNVPIFYHGEGQKALKVHKYNQKYNPNDNYQALTSNLTEIDKNSGFYSVTNVSEQKATLNLKQDSDDIIVVETTLQTKNPTYEVYNNPIKFDYLAESSQNVKSISGRVDILSMIKGTVNIERNPKYENVVDFKIDLPKAPVRTVDWELNQNLEFKIDFLAENLSNLTLVNMLIDVRDGDGNELPRNSIEISRISGGNNTSGNFTIKLKDSFKNGLHISVPISTKESQKYKLVQDGLISSKLPGSWTSFDKRKITHTPKEIDIVTSPTSGSGYLVATDANFNVIDKISRKGLAGAEFKLVDKVTKEEFEIGPSDENGNINLKGILVSTYYLKQTKAPAGYDLSPEYTQGDGREIIIVEDPGQNNYIIELGASSSVNVHFSYKDHSPIDEPTVKTIKITHAKGIPLDLSANELIKKAKAEMVTLKNDYRYLGFDAAGLTGGESNLVLTQETQDVYYQYEGLVSIKGPEELNFNKGKTSPFSQKLATNLQNPFKLMIRDNRQVNTSTETQANKTRGNIRIQAHVSKNFIGDTYHDELLKTQMVYLNSGVENILNGSGSEVARASQNVSSPSRKDFEFILEEKNNPSKGFKLNVAPGEAKAQNYTGELSFDLVQGP